MEEENSRRHTRAKTHKENKERWEGWVGLGFGEMIFTTELLKDVSTYFLPWFLFTARLLRRGDLSSLPRPHRPVQTVPLFAHNMASTGTNKTKKKDDGRPSEVFEP